jgi:CBS-domain-containing membrane protein
MADDRVVTHVHRTAELTPADWDDIWALTGEFYDVDREFAEAELRRRDRIALFRMNGALLGMASIGIYPETFRGRRIT